MSKIALLLPYREMIEPALAVIDREKADIDYVRAVETVDAVNEARRAVEEGARIVVARGYQAMLIREYLNVPVIEMRVHAQEMGLLIARAKTIIKKTKPNIGVLVYENMLCDMSHMGELMGAELTISYMHQADEMSETLRSLADKHPDIIIGGRAICTEAEKLGFPTIFLKAENESIAEAVKEAQTMLHVLENEEMNTAQMEAVFDTSPNAVIRLNAEGRIIAVSRQMENLIGKNSEDVIGESIGEVLPDIDEESIRGILEGKSDNYTATVNMRRTAFMLLAAPICFDEKITGSIVSLSRISGNLGREQRQRQDLYLNGYTARGTFSDIYTENMEMKAVLGRAKKYALSDGPVLIRSGEGTEYYAIAEAIHNNSRRKNGPFVSLRIRGLDKSQQIEALFGKAESPGDAREGGAMAKANHGTILIKGIEHLTLEAQHRIIRLLRPHTVSRTDARPIDALDVRIIALSKASLPELVPSGRISEEFFYLITGLTIRIPGLSERPEDLRFHFERFFKLFSKRYSKYSVLTQGGWEALAELPFTGNLIQLKAFTERLVLEVDKRNIDEVIIKKLYRELYPKFTAGDKESGKRVVYRSPEAVKLSEALKKCGGNRARTAEELGISTTTLWRKMKKYGLELQDTLESWLPDR